MGRVFGLILLGGINFHSFAENWVGAHDVPSAIPLANPTAFNVGQHPLLKPMLVTCLMSNGTWKLEYWSQVQPKDKRYPWVPVNFIHVNDFYQDPTQWCGNNLYHVRNMQSAQPARTCCANPAQLNWGIGAPQELPKKTVQPQPLPIPQPPPPKPSPAPKDLYSKIFALNKRPVPKLFEAFNRYCSTRYAPRDKDPTRIVKGSKRCDEPSYHCFMHVKFMLEDLGPQCWPKNFMGQGKAKNAGQNLSNFGFMLIGSEFQKDQNGVTSLNQKALNAPHNFTPIDAPNGSIITYQDCDLESNESKEPGHIEVKIDGQFYSDFQSPYRSGCKGYQIWYKPECAI